jgi:hypothetical protein
MHDAHSRPRDYCVEESRYPHPWTSVPTDERGCGHLRLQCDDEEPEQSVSFSELLGELRADPFADRFAMIREGRELAFLRNDIVVSTLSRALEDEANPKLSVESWLDNVFQDLRKGEVFEHTGAAMALLVAIRQAALPWFEEVAGVFANSSAAEIGRLSRFSRKLLAH